jgi:menaquinone-dependent protoporphyrinogen oxidase
MKTLIIYSSKYGYTQECAIKLSELINGDVTLVNGAKEKIPSIQEFDNVIIGSSIYIGLINSKIGKFCTENVDILKTKNLGFFISCGMPENFELHLDNSFPAELLSIAKSKLCFGGELRIDKMGFFHKIITGMMIKAREKDKQPSIESFPYNITKMADTFNEMEE